MTETIEKTDPMKPTMPTMPKPPAPPVSTVTLTFGERVVVIRFLTGSLEFDSVPLMLADAIAAQNELNLRALTPSKNDEVAPIREQRAFRNEQWRKQFDRAIRRLVT